MATSKTFRPILELEVAPGLDGFAQSEDRGQTDAFVGVGAIHQRGGEPVSEFTVVEPAGEHPSAEVAEAAGWRIELDRTSADRGLKAGTAKVVGDQRRMEILETLEADKREPPASPKVPAGHGLRSQRRRFRHP